MGQDRLKVALEPTPLTSRSGTRRSMVSMASSGIGGSNGHVVLESPPPQDADHSLIKSDSPILFIVGGLSPRAAQLISTSLIDILSKDSSPQALSQVVKHAHRTRQLLWRSHFIFTPGSTELPTNPKPVLAPKDAPPVIFVFTGQGPQHIRMGKALFVTYPLFRENILELDTICECVTGSSLVQTTRPFSKVDGPALPSPWPVKITLPAMAMFQIAMTDLLAMIGIKPTARETPMIYGSGAGPKEMALKIAITHSKAMKIMGSLGGGVAALGCDKATALEFIDCVLKGASESVLEVSCHNSLEAVVITGSPALIDEVVSLASITNVFVQRVQTLNPFHSLMTEVCKEEYLGNVKALGARGPGNQ